MIRFENISMVYLFGAIPLLLLLFFYSRYRRRKKLEQFGESTVVSTLMPNVSSIKPIVCYILLLIATGFLTIAILNPQIGSKAVNVKREGADIMICLDVSNSMMAEDISPSRLQRAKYAIEQLIDQLEGDRIGIIVFAGQAYVQLPITTDYAAGKLFLQNIETDIVPVQGTSIGSALELALESFGEDEGKNRAIVVITDGEDHEEDAIDLAKQAKEQNITVHTIGIGSPNGTPIPLYKNGIISGFRKDKEGNTVVSKLNEDILGEISEAGNGVYVHATGASLGLDVILDEIGELEKKQFESKMYVDYDDKFHYFIAISLILFVIEILIGENKSPIWKKINLFGEEGDNA